MYDLELTQEYKLIIRKLRYQQETKTYAGKSALEFARDCTKESTIALMYGLTEEADLIMDIMDAALTAHQASNL
tara:strand:- start:3829 stop:4050 length:222 start_codon:yes stop_codon:yes gene_type:complete